MPSKHKPKTHQAAQRDPSTKASAVASPPVVDATVTQASSEASQASAPPSQIETFLGTLTAQLQQLTAMQGELVRRLDAQHQVLEPSVNGTAPPPEEAMPAATPPEASYDAYTHAGFGAGPMVTTSSPVPPQTAAYAQAGLIPPPPQGALPQLSAEQAMKLVAFIPKDDPLNPRNSLFETWINGRHYRAKRGQTMMLPRAHAVMLAASDHGYVVDIEMMQGLQIPRLPDYSRPDSWDGSVPSDAASSIPPAFYQRQVA